MDPEAGIDDYKAYKRNFKGGIYKPYKMLVDQFTEIGIVVIDPEQQLFNPFILVFDIESLLQRLHSPEDEEEGESLRNTMFTHRHKPVSVSVCSNVPGFRCCDLVNFAGTSRFIEVSVEFMVAASEEAERLCHEKAHSLYQTLENITSDALVNQKQWMVNKVARLRKQLDRYYKQLRCLTYNGSSYDLVALVREGLCYYLKKHDSTPMAVKLGNRYILISTEKLRFLDVIQFCGGKTSLRNFLRTWGDSTLHGEKLFFPYSSLTNTEDLFREELPAYDEFYSDLCGLNVLEEEWIKFERLLTVGLTENEALAELKLHERPRTGREHYEILWRIWEENNCEYLYQFLLIYNKSDVEPLMHAVINMMKHWMNEEQIDPFCKATLSGLAFPLLMRNLAKAGLDKDTNFFCLLDRECYDLISDSIHGGISHSFNRLEFRGYSKIKEHRYGPDAKTMKSVYAFDANGLYSGCIGEFDQCLGYYAHRKRETNFRIRTVNGKNKLALAWLMWLSKVVLQQYVRTMLCLGGERVCVVNGRRLFADGFVMDPGETQGTVYLFHECEIHSCPTCLGEEKFENDLHPLKKISHRQNYQETKDYEQLYYKNKDVKEVRVMWSHQFKQMIREDPTVRGFVESIMLGPPEVEREVTEQRVVELIRAKKLFGFAEVDIRVPETLYDYFAEWPPLFAKQKLGAEDLDPRQKAFAEKHGLLKTPNLNLVSVMEAKKTVIHTDLLIWYLEHGLEVTRVHSLTQWRCGNAFGGWLNKIVVGRREAAITGDVLKDLTNKLLANSSYGYALLNLAKRPKVKFVEDKKLDKLMKSRYFRKMQQAGPSVA
ncbi:hypothetical protein [Neptuniibacter sp.]|uniref:hypothetical protein n=1 Tax=Neptuniibacter sp. TaxID=1962643 RepID=UPI002619BA21|nr:hypothetical protein [Neptuniibacter sp.]MCP4597141.1 hypothetical protein [Neptuniibacter sp.]